MEWCTRVYHPSALFFCMVYTCLLANEEKLFITCSHDWNVLFFRYFSGFDIVRHTFLKVSTVPLEFVRVFQSRSMWAFPSTSIWHVTCPSHVDFFACSFLCPTIVPHLLAIEGRHPCPFFLFPRSGYLSSPLARTSFLLWHERTPPGSPNCPIEYITVARLAYHRLMGILLLVIDSPTPWRCWCVPQCFLHLCTSASQSSSSKRFCWGHSSFHTRQRAYCWERRPSVRKCKQHPLIL